MTFTLPTSLSVGGKECPIRTSWTAALDIINALADTGWTPAQKAEIILTILYTVPIPRQHAEEAIRRAYWYLDGGQEQNGKNAPTLMDWQKDWPLIVAPINRVVGHDVRIDDGLHWWTFLAAYMEIGGDCTLAQIVSIRDKLARGEKLEDYEKKFASRNADLLSLPNRFTQADKDSLAADGII